MNLLDEKTEITKLLSGQGDALPLFKVFMSEDAITAAAEVLKSGYIGQGPRVDRFEKELSNWCSSSNILTLNAGTSAIHLALRLAGVEHGDEVISTPMTCVATNVPILASGAKIVWADINPNTGNLCPESVKKKITSKTKAIICVDWGGDPCELNELQSIAEANNIKLIEDAAHGFGSKYKGKSVGGLVDYTCFSFQAIKHLTTVDGGALICRNDDDYARGKLLRWFGINREGARVDFRCEEDILEYGYKFHMNDVSAAIGLAQLLHIEPILRAHRENAVYYNQRFSQVNSPKLRLLHTHPDRESAYWLYTLRIDNRNEFMHEMKAKKIVVSQVHARNDTHTVFKEFKCSLPGVDAFTHDQVSIPVGWWINESQREYIADAVIDFVNKK